MRMTEQEAIKRIKKKHCTENQNCTDSCMHGVEHCAYSMANKALEKQIPKKPETYQDGYTCCPTCDNYIITLNPNRQKESNYCDKCGQKLDWSEV